MTTCVMRETRKPRETRHCLGFFLFPLLALFIIYYSLVCKAFVPNIISMTTNVYQSTPPFISQCTIQSLKGAVIRNLVPIYP